MYAYKPYGQSSIFSEYNMSTKKSMPGGKPGGKKAGIAL
jgi:hypothetical protein